MTTQSALDHSDPTTHRRIAADPPTSRDHNETPVTSDPESQRGIMTSSPRADQGERDLAEFRALVEENRRVIASVNTGSSSTSASPPYSGVIFGFSPTILNRGCADSPSLIAKEAKDASHLSWKSAEATRARKENLLYKADKEYKAVKVDQIPSTGERNSLKRKRDCLEVELKVAILQEKSCRELHRKLDYLSYQVQSQGPGQDAQFPSALTGKLTPAEINARSDVYRLEKRRRSQLP
ncbi:uncharacterized protein J4E79_007080 [Alternaria viburni]|uniref:uncharacterized protein n=1 Tax=Alternaria viburni TaxID=566460 RepID=UPI0020C3E409|nr:uncharacterized protein J4E79_007080 [Alternaria viburni]KAI4658099.1 hypothetical protein J4E79_007080 [Alternaria viburni]